MPGSPESSENPPDIKKRTPHREVHCFNVSITKPFSLPYAGIGRIR